ncbi:MAG: hypothetical protein ACKVW3_13495 [Phycisphaerales bacterium]
MDFTKRKTRIKTAWFLLAFSFFGRGAKLLYNLLEKHMTTSELAEYVPGGVPAKVAEIATWIIWTASAVWLILEYRSKAKESEGALIEQDRVRAARDGLRRIVNDGERLFVSPHLLYRQVIEWRKEAAEFIGRCLGPEHAAEFWGCDADQYPRLDDEPDPENPSAVRGSPRIIYTTEWVRPCLLIHIRQVLRFLETMRPEDIRPDWSPMPSPAIAASASPSAASRPSAPAPPPPPSPPQS